MQEQKTILPSLSLEFLPIRSSVVVATLLGLIVFSQRRSDGGFLVLAALGLVLGLAVALRGQRRARLGVGLGLVLSVVSSGVLWESLRQFEFLRLLALLVPLVLTHVYLWLSAGQRRSWRPIALWALLAAHAVALTLYLGSTRLPCSPLDPLRVMAGCQGVSGRFGADEYLKSLTTTSQGVLAVTSDPQQVRLRRIDDGALLLTIPRSSQYSLTDVIVSADGSLAVSAGDSSGFNVWRVADGAQLQPISDQLTRAASRLSTMAVSPDGQTLATTTTREDVLKLWRVSDGALLRTIPVGIPYAAAFSPDGQLLAVVDRSQLVLWRVSDGQQLRTLDIAVLADETISFSSDGTLLAVGGSRSDPNGKRSAQGRPNEVQVWRVADGVRLQTFAPARSATGSQDLLSFAFTPDGTALATSFLDAPIQIWRVSDGALLRSIDRAVYSQTLAFSDDGRTLLIPSSTQIYRWAAQ